MATRQSNRRGSAGRRSTIGDVARHAGVSAATVSRVVNGVFDKASPETIARVQDSIRELNYRPGSIGRALRKQESRLVPFLVPDVGNAYYAAIAVAIEAALHERDYAMILCNTGEMPDIQDAYLAEMQSHLVPGFVMMGAVESAGLARMVEAGDNLIFVNRRNPYEGDQPFVGIDNAGAGRDIADYLARTARLDCAMIHGPLSSSASRDRMEGFQAGLAAHGVELPKSRIAEGGLTPAGGYEAASRLFDGGSPPKAIFCVNDLTAYGAYRRCTELGFGVPDDIQLFGIDDNPMNEWVAPWLSTVHIPTDAMGQAVGTMIMRFLDGMRVGDIADVLLPYSIVVHDQ